MKINKTFSSAVFLGLCLGISTSSLFAQTFQKTDLSRDFITEGVAVGDLNKDGQLDIIAGYYWFEAPNWTKHQIGESRVFDPRKEYSDSFLNMSFDVNFDGWDDVIIVDHPGKPGNWFENPKNESGDWKKHVIANGMGIANESPGFVDIDGDGRLDILCADFEQKQIVWLQAPTKKGDTEWKRHELSAKDAPSTERYSHGLGFGDINQDGYNDVIITSGWFEGKADLSSGDWVFHAANLGEDCSHMQVLDVNHDGKNDVVSAAAHKLGVWWHEQYDDNGTINFRTHLMSETTHQTHATIMADLNGDGQNEMITGKRYLAHNGRDEGDEDAALIFYFEFTKEAPYFKEHMINEDSGAGLNIAVADMDKDGHLDIVIANKNGVFLLKSDGD